ncbi:hypothetical protein TNCT_687601 [Trichonephila clavata]|uniref:Uncharacterized protein n=1 Tax=Trichonephila clavata TaxID=2740835 RepID=A0A8X6HU48_TRICU|nr:hypothetical protein TNCT_687601 [Trichonephila clavata]
MGLFWTNLALNLSCVHSPPFNYCCEPLATLDVLDTLGKIQNQSLSIADGALKTTLIESMLVSMIGDKP